MTVDIAPLVSDNLDVWTTAVERKSGAGRGGGKRINLYGVDRLRALILDLAIRGKLVPQEAGDEPASNLVKDFAKQRADWIAKKQMRSGKPLPKITEREIRFTSPSGWVWTRFFEVGDWGAGATPNRKMSSYYGGETPWFKSGELNADYVSEAEETVTEMALRECSLRVNSPGDVLLAMYGATIGKASILAVRATTNQAVCACTPFKGIGSRFLLLLLKAMRPQFVSQGAGGAQPNISREKIIATPFCLPPAAEQQRIVAKVDELMALCDALEAESAAAMAAHQALVEALLATLTASTDAADLATSWARPEAYFDTLFTTEASVDALKRTILELAVQGKLTRSNALKRVEISRSFELLDGDRGPKYPKQEDYFSRGHCLFLSTKNVRKNGFLFDETQYISEEKHRELRQGTLKKGDLIITTRGTLGNVAFYDESVPYPIVRINSGMLIMRPKNEDILQNFMMLFIQSPSFDEQMQSKRSGSAQPQIPAGVLKSFVVPVFTPSDQQCIVAKVDELMALCDALKARVTDAATTQKHLADAITERAAA